jgi:NADH:ubiquinone reductase (H+-translocating)
MPINIPETDKKRVVIAGAGFAGLTLARKLIKIDLEVVLLDRNNYHQFQPLFYQVATAGLEPSAISFPLRKIFQKVQNIHIRMAEVQSIDPVNKQVMTDIGYVWYDYLIIAMGAETNFFGMQHVKEKAVSMKSVAEALYLRNRILENYEASLLTRDQEEKEGLLNIAIVGGGPTGAEVAGALAEMRRYVLPKDYPELNFDNMKIYLLEAGQRLLNAMSEPSSQQAYKYLRKLDVEIMTNSIVTDYDGNYVTIKNQPPIHSKTLIWASGIICNKIPGLDETIYNKRNRIKVDQHNRIIGYENIFAIGDIAAMQMEGFPDGHPQVAPVAIQQARLLSRNLRNLLSNKPLSAFKYIDKGSLATIGRNLAVAEFPFIRLKGFMAWIIWMFVHLMSIVGIKNRMFIFLNWLWNYMTYDQSLRLIIRQKGRNK